MNWTQKIEKTWYYPQWNWIIIILYMSSTHLKLYVKDVPKVLTESVLYMEFVVMEQMFESSDPKITFPPPHGVFLKNRKSIDDPLIHLCYTTTIYLDSRWMTSTSEAVSRHHGKTWSRHFEKHKNNRCSFCTRTCADSKSSKIDHQQNSEQKNDCGTFKRYIYVYTYICMHM